MEKREVYISQLIPKSRMLEEQLKATLFNSYNAPSIISLPKNTLYQYSPNVLEHKEFTHTTTYINWDEWFIKYYIYFMTFQKDKSLIEIFPSILGETFTYNLMQLYITDDIILTSCINPQMMCCIPGEFTYRFVWFGIDALFRIKDFSFEEKYICKTLTYTYEENIN